MTRLGHAFLTSKEWARPTDFVAESPATWGTLYEGLSALGVTASKGLLQQKSLPLTRSECVRHLWTALQQAGEWQPSSAGYLTPSHDSDGDGIPDLDDALPFDHNNRNLPDRLNPSTP